MVYDLEERVSKFGEDIILFLRGFSKDQISRPMISQLVRSATSVGANYMEANQAASKKDFRNKIILSKKEANESKHWLRMLSVSNNKKTDVCRKLWKEAHELTLIFSKISRNCDSRN